MRCALLLTGRLRTFRDCHAAMREHLPKADVFVCGWNTLAGPEPTWDAIDSWRQQHGDWQEMLDLYQPVAVSETPWDDEQTGPQFSRETDRDRFFPVEYYRNVRAMHSRWQRAADLFGPSLANYDVVIKSRFDVLHQQAVVVETALERGALVVPVGGDYTGLNDQWAFGSPAQVDWYLRLASYAYLVEDGHGYSERLLAAHLASHDIPVIRVDIAYTLQR